MAAILQPNCCKNQKFGFVTPSVAPVRAEWYQRLVPRPLDINESDFLTKARLLSGN